MEKEKTIQKHQHNINKQRKHNKNITQLSSKNGRKSVQKACFWSLNSPLCREKLEEHDFGNENRRGGQKEVQFGTAGDRKSIMKSVPTPPIDRKRASIQAALSLMTGAPVSSTGSQGGSHELWLEAATPASQYAVL